MSATPLFEALTPALVWGLWQRLLGVVYVAAFFSMRRDVLVVAGSRGITPHARTLARMRADYPGARRFFYFPSLLWLGSSDRALRGWLTLGIVAALVVVWGGPLSFAALLLCWAVLLSYDAALDLAYPWESALLEAGFLALFLPAAHALPQLAATEVPVPALSWAHRWLLFRVLFGFGKFRFLSGGKWDWTYLRSFLVGQPIPTKLGWLGARLPGWVHRVALVLMFFVEIPLPFFVFARGNTRVFAAAGIAALMIAIQLTGNFGFFNLLMVSLSVVLLDRDASVFELTRAQVHHAPVTHFVVLVLALGGLLHLPFSTWVSRSWLYWPVLQGRLPLPLRVLLGFYRALMPFRVVQSYGVFPPYLGPPARWVTKLQGTHDGVTWLDYEFRYMPSSERARPQFIAPLCPRIDHALFYEALGVSSNGLYGSFFSLGIPYRYARWSPIQRLVQRLLEGEPLVAAHLGHNPFPDPARPPKQIRVRLVHLESVSVGEQARTGRVWKATDAGVHLPPTGIIEGFWDDTVPEPEQFHWDERWWHRKAPALRALREAAPERWREAVRARGASDEEIEAFFSELVPMLRGPVRDDWAHFDEAIERVEARFTGAELRRIERVAAACAYMLGARLEPHYEGAREPKLSCESWFHLGLLVHAVMLDGLDAYERALRSPEGLAAKGHESSTQAGLLLWGVFRPEMLRTQARKARLIAATLGKEGQPPFPRGVPGFVHMAPWLEGQLVREGEETLPRWRRGGDLEWVRVEE